MSIALFQRLKRQWGGTKPIRGRSADVRPLAARRKDWETIEKVFVGGDSPDPEGRYGYALRFHNTDCVTAYPNGDVRIKHGGWVTNTTTQFINEFSTFSVCNRFGRMWVWVGGIAYPIPNDGLLLKHIDGAYRVSNKPQVFKRSVNRARAAELRAPYQPFIAWAESIVKLYGGEVPVSFVGEAKAVAESAQLLRSVQFVPLLPDTENAVAWTSALYYIVRSKSSRNWGVGNNAPYSLNIKQVRSTVYKWAEDNSMYDYNETAFGPEPLDNVRVTYAHG